MTDPATANTEKTTPPAPYSQNGWAVFRRRIKKIRLPRLLLHEEGLFLLLAVIIGLFSGLAVVCFQISIDWTRIRFLGSSLSPSPLRALLVPALAGLGVAVITERGELLRGAAIFRDRG